MAYNKVVVDSTDGYSLSISQGVFLLIFVFIVIVNCNYMSVVNDVHNENKN